LDVFHFCVLNLNYIPKSIVIKQLTLQAHSNLFLNHDSKVLPNLNLKWTM